MWPVFVINMADNPVRMDKCRAALSAQGIEFTRFEAVNGRELSPSEIAEVYDMAANQKQFRHKMIAGEFGCYLSHIGLWRQIAEGDADGAIILEDDFSAADDLGKVLQALSQDHALWDMVKLFSRRPGKKMLRMRDLCVGHQLAVPFQVPNTTLGYIIRKDAARRLLETSLPFSRPIDEDHKRFWEHGLDIRLVQPPPLTLGVEAAKAGSIQASRKSGAGGGLLQGWKNLRYRVGYLLTLYFYRILGR